MYVLGVFLCVVLVFVLVVFCVCCFLLVLLFWREWCTFVFVFLCKHTHHVDGIKKYKEIDFF